MISGSEEFAYNKKAADIYEDFGDKVFKGDIALLDHLGSDSLKNKVVLDFGCGNGRMERRFLSMGPKKIVAVEISDQMLANARASLVRLPPKDAAKLSFEKLNSGKLPFESGAFDVVIVHFVFHYILKLDETVRELFRVMKDGGKIFITVNDFSFKPGFEHLENTSLPLVIGEKLVVDVLAKTRNDIEMMLKKAGFVLDEVESFDNTSAHVAETYPQRDNIIFGNTIVVAHR